MEISPRNYPNMSVLLTSYKRKEFIREALESVINQTIPREVYEIICVIGFHDDNLSLFLLDNNVREIYCEGRLGERLVLGIKACTSDIVVFLDDDDKFRKDKLELVALAFEKYNCIYYHNNTEMINARSEIILRSIQPYDKQIVRSFVWNPIRGYRNILKHRGDFNLSSIAIKKSKIDLSIINGIEASPDTGIFFLLMQLKLPFYFDINKTTFYRIHESETNSIGIIDKDIIIATSLRYYRSRLTIFEGLSYAPVKKIFLGPLLESKFGTYIVGNNDFKPGFMEKMKFFYISLTRPSGFYLRLFAAVIIYRLFPDYVKKVRYRRKVQRYKGKVG